MKKILFLISYLSEKRWLFIFSFYVVIIILITPTAFPWAKKGVFLLYSLCVFGILYNIFKMKGGAYKSQLTINFQRYNKFFVYLLIFSFVSLFIVRLLPFLHFGEAPLGYDTGFYIYDIEHVSSSVKNEGGIYPEKAFYFIFFPLNYLGFSPIHSFNLVYILIQFLLAGGLYLIFRSLKIKNNFELAAVAVFVFVISTTQFHAYWSMFPKQLFASSLFLMGIALLLKRSYLAILPFILAALINVPTFAVFAIGAVLYFIVILGKNFFTKVRSNRKLLWYSVLAFGLILFFVMTKFGQLAGYSGETYAVLIWRALYLGRWLIIIPIVILLTQFLIKRTFISNQIIYPLFLFLAVWNAFYWLQDYRYILDGVNYLVKYKGLATNFPAWKIGEMRGLFINVDTFRYMNMSLIPFGLFTFLNPWLWKQKQKVKKDSINFMIFNYTMFILLLILVSFPFIYQYRSVVFFDVFFIIFAVPALYLLINSFLEERAGLILAVIFILIKISTIAFLVWNRQPQFFPDELQELKKFALTAEPDAYIMATNSRYTPWLHGFSGRIAIGPGYLNDDWGLDTWIMFWGGSDNEERHQLLEERPQPLYLFVGAREPTSQPYYKFIQEDPQFDQISPHIWKYHPEI